MNWPEVEEVLVRRKAVGLGHHHDGRTWFRGQSVLFQRRRLPCRRSTRADSETDDIEDYRSTRGNIVTPTSNTCPSHQDTPVKGQTSPSGRSHLRAGQAFCSATSLLLLCCARIHKTARPSCPLPSAAGRAAREHTQPLQRTDIHRANDRRPG